MIFISVCVCGRRLGTSCYVSHSVQWTHPHTVEELVMHMMISVVAAFDWRQVFRNDATNFPWGTYMDVIIQYNHCWFNKCPVGMMAVIQICTPPFSVSNRFSECVFCSFSRYWQAWNKEMPQHSSLRKHFCGGDRDLQQCLNRRRKSQPLKPISNHTSWIL